MTSPAIRCDVGSNVERLATIRGALLEELAHNHARFLFINTRLILSVGVDLNDTPRSTEADFKNAKVALETLHKMGFLRDREGGRGA